eukprot:g9664.t1
MTSLVIDDDDHINDLDSVEVPLLSKDVGNASTNDCAVRDEHDIGNYSVGQTREEVEKTRENKVESNSTENDLIFSPASFTDVLFPVSVTVILSTLSIWILDGEAYSLAIGEGLRQTYVQSSVGKGKGEDGGYTFGQTIEFSLLFVAVITVMTFMIVLVLFFKCYRVIFCYLVIAYSFSLGVTGWVFVSAILGDVVGIPIDTVSMSFIMYNFAIGGCLAIFWQGKIVKPIKKIFMDFYLISISILMAYIFSQFSQLGGELLVWSILVALAFYDLCAVLSPCGPLKLLLKVVSSDKEGKTGDQLSGLLYTAGDGEDTMEQFYGGGEDNHGNDNTSHAGNKAVSNVQLSEMSSGNSNDGAPERNQIVADHSETSLSGNATSQDHNSQPKPEKSRPVRLGLGDFIFYSILTSTAGKFGGYLAAAVCILTIQVGLGSTLMLLVVAKQALPALPIPILICVLLYSILRASTIDYLSGALGQGYIL